jgi:hypothetical protein
MGAGVIERVQAVAGRLLLHVRGDVLPVAVACEDTEAAVVGTAPLDGGRTLVAIDLDDVADLALWDEPVRYRLLGAGVAVLGEGAARLSPLATDARGIGEAGLLERALAADLWDMGVAAALRWRLAEGTPGPGEAAGIHLAEPLGNGLALAGWAADAGERALLILNDGLESARRGGDVASFRRPEISERLRAGGQEVAGDRHGFVTTLPLLRPGDRGVLLFETRGPRATFLGRLSWSGARHGAAGEAMRLIADAWGEEPAPEVTRRLLAPLTVRRPEPARAPVVLREEQAPLLSAVLPITSRAGAAALALTAGRWPVGTELLLQGANEAYWRDRAGLIERGLVLGRTGMAPVVLLAPGPVQLEDAAGLEAAVAAVRQGWGVVGLQTLFPDGTLAADAFGATRGLPPLPAEPGVQPVAAVTGPVVVERPWLERLGGLSRRYATDAAAITDLCLRSADAGRAVGIVREGVLRNVGARSPWAWVDAVRLRDRWAGRLPCAS